MKYIIIILLFLLDVYANDLKFETSPYLLQHSKNPINWHAYNDKTLALAKKENKPIFLSIGYSTCHWCHVMAEESFTNEKLAKLFNKYFINIKVDKEEMPHLDSKYQELFKSYNNHAGGWPLNIFMTPDLKVFYISAYILPITKEDYIGFDTLLESLHVEYISDKYKVIKIKQAEKKEDKGKITIVKLIESVNNNYDDLSSGFGNEVKFPEASKLSLMLDLYELSGDEQMKEYAIDMLDAMALHGLYDHVDGGFFRYSIDANWEIPHFEKMLYNQAELIGLYTRAYLLTKKELYKKVVEETILMCDEVFLKDGLYYSASDAVSNKEEGGYFIYSKKELLGVLGDTKYATLFNAKYHITSKTNKRDKLKKIRSKREYPFVDKKINTAWNALMIEALYKASAIDNRYLKEADFHLKTLTKFMFDKGELHHQSLLHVEPTQVGFLEDYSFMIGALIAGYEVDSNEDKISFAKYLLASAKYKFCKNNIWYLSDDELNIKASTSDLHYVSAVSKMIQNIIKLASIDSSKEYKILAKESLEALHVELSLKQSSAPALARAYLMLKSY